MILLLSSLALGCIGDAYMELADTDNALMLYEDAAEIMIMILQLQDICLNKQ